MYALCTTVCYQDDVDDLLNQHSQILADKFVIYFLKQFFSKNCPTHRELMKVLYLRNVF
jgi:hypothetical protein